MAAAANIKINPPLEGDGDGRLPLQQWLPVMEDYLVIKDLDDIIELAEGHVYTAAQTRRDNLTKYVLKRNLSEVRRSTVDRLPHASDIWRRLTQVSTPQTISSLSHCGLLNIKHSVWFLLYQT